ncbi:HdeA/HdeB family chaperone [Novispirillum sp. DQ9]|uniref:HdeA/HdeB family chaperone n=1 Tax=Novispirillum sp. DQ9 TaxID=3398612 RepID=UPI003C7D5B23
MKAFLAATVVALPLLFASEAFAQKKLSDDHLDLGAMSCGDFLTDAETASEDDLGVLFMWLDGYLSGVSGDTVLKFSGIQSFAGRLIDYCAGRPKARLLDAARATGIQ